MDTMEITIDSIHKIKAMGNEVTFYELIGECWVDYGSESWSDELIAELIADN